MDFCSNIISYLNAAIMLAVNNFSNAWSSLVLVNAAVSGCGTGGIFMSTFKLSVPKKDINLYIKMLRYIFKIKLIRKY